MSKRAASGRWIKAPDGYEPHAGLYPARFINEDSGKTVRVSFHRDHDGPGEHFFFEQLLPNPTRAH